MRGNHESPSQQEMENQVIPGCAAIRLSPGGTRDKVHVEARTWGTKCWVAGLLGDGIDSRGHGAAWLPRTPESVNGERKMHSGEEKPHGRWEGILPLCCHGTRTEAQTRRLTP